MLNKCANPGCVRPFRKLEDGKLFLVEIEASTASGSARAGAEGGAFRQLEHYWLCDPCASVLTLSFEPERGVVAVPLARQAGKGRQLRCAGLRLPAPPRTKIIAGCRLQLGGSNEA